MENPLFTNVVIKSLFVNELNMGMNDKPIYKKDFRQLYVSRKLLNAEDIVQWAKEQGIPDMCHPDDLHVTISYSTKLVDFSSLEPVTKKLTIRKGKRHVERLGKNPEIEGFLVLRFETNVLEERWQYYRDQGASWDFPDYLPHVSIRKNDRDTDLSKIKPYMGDLIFGPEVIEPLGSGSEETISLEESLRNIRF